MAKEQIPPEVNRFPRFVFSRATLERNPGSPVRVRNGLDEDPRGGTIIKQVGRAYLVDVQGEQLVVHEPDDSWGPPY